MIPRTTVDIGDAEKKAIERVFDSGQYVKGSECLKLEEEFSFYQKVKCGAGVNSGTSALHLSLLALDVKPGDEIITSPNTFAATVNSIILTGAKPVFSDIDPATFNLDPEKIKNAITEKTKVIIPVHLYGLIADMKPIKEITEDHNIKILEDACQAHGAEYYDKRAGSLGDLAAFSFFPTKNATVAGDGGIVLSNNEELIEKIKALSDHGRVKGKHTFPGLNNRLSELLAAIGREHIKNLDAFNFHRRSIAGKYNESLKEIMAIETPSEPENHKHVYHLYTIKTEKRDKLKQYLKDNGIGSTVMYQERLNDLDYVKTFSEYKPMPVNDEVNSKILSLPISGTMNLEKIEYVCEKIIEFFS